MVIGIFLVAQGIKNLPKICLQCRGHKRHRFSPWVGKIPWRRKWQPTRVVLLEESHGFCQRSLAGYRWCHKEWDTTEPEHGRTYTVISSLGVLSY